MAALLSEVKKTPELHNFFRSRDANYTTFDTLWTLFPPGKLIVARLFMDVPQILRVEDAPTPYNTGDRDNHYRIWAWQWDWDGKMMVKVHYRLSIPRFQGSKCVVDLPLYPLLFHNQPGPEELCAYIRQRSLRYLNATIRCDPGAGQMLLYTGYAYAHPWAESLQDADGSVSRCLLPFCLV